MYEINLNSQINLAIEYLQQGKLVAFPTETVYGLAACINNPAAIQKVFAAKQRPTNHPLIVHIANINQLNQVAINIPPDAYTLAQNFWPGALTLILEKHPSVPDLITAGYPTVGVRIPQHPITLQLLKKLNIPLVGPSANTFGKVSPTSYLHVKKDLKEKVDLILDGGQCTVGIESTILSLVNPAQPTILRPGNITAEQIFHILGKPVNLQFNSTFGTQVSGQLDSHYQPCKPLYVIKSGNIHQTIDRLAKKKLNLLVFSFSPAPIQITPTIIWHTIKPDPIEFAQELYSRLHLAETTLCNCILLEATPDTEEWQAINNRLQRASSINFSEPP